MIIVNEIRYLAKGDEWGSDGDIEPWHLAIRVKLNAERESHRFLPQVAEASSPR
jgi:hypothetical protein